MDSLPVYQQLRLTDIADWDSTLFGSAIDIVQLKPGRFQSEQEIVDLGLLQVLRLKVNQSIAARGRDQTSRYAAIMFDAADDGDIARFPIKRKQWVVLPSHFEFDACAKGQCFSCTAAFVDASYLRDYCHTLTGELLASDADRSARLIADAQTANRLTLCVNSIFDVAAGNDAALQKKEYRNAVLDEIVTLLMQPFLSPDIPPLTKLRSKMNKARQLVNQAEDYVRMHPGTPVRLIELCQHTKVSERTLQYAFQRVLGVSPMQYLSRFRLHQVHAALSQHKAASTTVTTEACRWGFWHLSEFASSYRELFGELPSETLQGKSEN